MKKAFTILLIIGLILIVGGGIFTFTKKQSKPEEEQPKKETLKLDDSIIEETINKLVPLGCDVDLPLSYILEKDSITGNDVPNNVAMSIIAKKTVGSKVAEETVDEDEVSNWAKLLFGSHYELEHKDYKDYGFEYNKDKHEYTMHIAPWGCTSYPHTRTLAKVTKAVVDGDDMIFTYQVLFNKPEEIPENPSKDFHTKYYKDYQMTQEIDSNSIKYDTSKEHIFVADENALENYNLGATYELRFTLQFGEYIFVKSELKK